MTDRKIVIDDRRNGLAADVATILPSLGDFFERVGFPVVMALVLVIAGGYGFFLGLKALDKNTAALSGVQAAVENNTKVMDRIFLK